MKKFNVYLRTTIEKHTVIQVSALDEQRVYNTFYDGGYDEVDEKYLDEEEEEKEIIRVEEVSKSKKITRSKK